MFISLSTQQLIVLISTTKIMLFYSYIYRLDDESRQLQDLERRGNRCIDVPSVQREGVYFGFQDALNPVVADDSSSKVFIRKPHDNSKTTQNYCYKAMDDD